ncbi:MAG: molecular chaperone DnaJ [Polyangiaceae bacterium]|nr:molecular chaperone DnaJ [Polyangiaceae bacterium]MCW5789687.1 molecular chaperone DnaJ [Polyangiaceae bacterium]
MRDPYDLLGVRRDATPEQIKAAFRRAAVKHHPDRNPNDPTAQARFAELNRAYQILADPKHRKTYDRFGAAAFERGGGERGFSEYIDLSQIDGMLGEILGAFGLKQTGKQRLMQRASLSFEEAALGATREFCYARLDHCKTCHGSGAEVGTSKTDCKNCGGRGKIRMAQGVLPLPIDKPCPSCHGSGQVPERPCASCQGRGLTQQTRTLTVSFPPGVEDGGSQVERGGGNRPRPGADYGDLEIAIQVTKHPLFEREGGDIRCRVPISFVQATLGGEVEVPTLAGKARVRVPPETASGTVLRLRGQGVPRRALGRGDQLVEVYVEIPKLLTPRAKALLLELSEELGESAMPQQKSFMEKLRGLF